jgi:hypothetical protein
MGQTANTVSNGIQDLRGMLFRTRMRWVAVRMAIDNVAEFGNQ